MRRLLLAVFSLCVCGSLFQGCLSPRPRIADRIKQPRAFYAEVDGVQRLFSSIGFLLLDDSLEGKLALASDDAGHVDDSKLRALVPDADIRVRDGYLHFRRPSGAWKDALIGNGRVVAVDPALDEIIIKMMAALREGGDRLPPISLPSRPR